MKKYNRLFLLVLTAISLALFLIYRREYNRLHYVLEVFNFFGQPCNITHLQRNGGTVLSHHDWGPSPSWTPLPGGYVYSAFLTSPNEVKALSLITEEKLMARSCFVWFEDKKRPVVGKFKYSKGVVNRRAGTMLGAFMCTVAASDSVKAGNSSVQQQQPYAVSFGFKKEKYTELKKIMLTQAFGRDNIVNSTVCVAPSTHNKRQLVEFLSYHKLLGVSSFIIYNKDVPHRLVTLLLNLSPMLDMKITLLPWNYPKLDSYLTRAVVEQDCLLRTFGQTTYVTVLELNEYIVPKTAYSFNVMMQTFQSKAERVSLPVKKFCVNNLEAKKPVALSNSDSLVSTGNNSSVSIYESAKSTNSLVTLLVHDTQAVVHKYVKCPNDTPKTLVDNSILKFSTDFVRTTLFQLFLHEQI